MCKRLHLQMTFLIGKSFEKTGNDHLPLKISVRISENSLLRKVNE